MRVLVTNDDGLHAPGLAHLAAAAVDAGHDVVVVAPEGNRSGSGAAIGDLGEQSSLRCRDMPLEALAGVHSVELDAPPALCVITACLGAFGDPPELVLSGINPGLNTGRSALHSGTVGAAVTAAGFGVPGVAVSIAGHEPEVVNWRSAAGLALRTAGWVADRAAERGEVLTVNLSVPDLPPERLGPPRVGTLAPMGAIHTEVSGRDEEWLHLGFRPTERRLPEGSDSRLAAEGHVVVTPVRGMALDDRADGPDLVAHLARGAAGAGAVDR